MNTGTSTWLMDRDYHAAIKRNGGVTRSEANKERHMLLDDYNTGCITKEEFVAAIKKLEGLK